MEILEIETPRGPARAHIERAPDPPAALILGHGAGGGIQAKDLVVATEVAGRAGLTVVLVEQPYRVAGRKAPAPAHHLDEAWVSFIEGLRAARLATCH